MLIMLDAERRIAQPEDLLQVRATAESDRIPATGSSLISADNVG
jgi:hypothetical protein